MHDASGQRYIGEQGFTAKDGNRQEYMERIQVLLFSFTLPMDLIGLSCYNHTEFFYVLPNIGCSEIVSFMEIEVLLSVVDEELKYVNERQKKQLSKR